MPKIIQHLLVQETSNLLKEKIEQLKTLVPAPILRSDVALLKSYYQQQSSYLSRIADWYYQHAWWQKTLFVIGLVGGVLSLTAALYALALMTVTALVVVNLLVCILCLATAITLHLHARAEEKRFHSMCEQIHHLEADAQNSIQSFQQIKGRLATILNELSEQHGMFDSYAQQIEEQINQLNSEILTAKATFIQVNNVIEALHEDATSLDVVNKDMKAQREVFQTAVVQDTTKVTKIGGQLTENSSALKVTEALLEEINQGLLVQNNAIKAQTDVLEKKMETTENNATALFQDSEDIEALLQQSQTLCGRVDRQLHQGKGQLRQNLSSLSV